MTANLAQTETCFPDSSTAFTAPETRQMPPVPIHIRTESVCLDLVLSGRMSTASPSGAGLKSDSDNGWMWAASTGLGTPLGFVTLNQKRAGAGGEIYFGPQLEIACRRDDAHARFIPEAIIGLIDWLRVHDICMALYAEHARADEQLAKWLVSAGFLYTGCYSPDGKRQMICLI